jgi:putative SOS response-associated peptidase YedK
MPRDTLVRLLRVDVVEAPELAISWNVAPTQPVYAAVGTQEGTRVLRGLRWGLVPSWAKDPRIGGRLINARSETVTQRPAFRAAIRTQRALLPVSGFYEWRRPEPGARAAKQPYYFHRADGGPLVFAGSTPEPGQPNRAVATASCTSRTTAARPTAPSRR